MTTTTAPTDPHPDVEPLQGSEFVGTWELDPLPYRVVFGFDRTVTDHNVRVYASAVQLADGTVDSSLIEGPSVYVASGENDGLEPLNSDQARELASALLEAAAEIDGWAAR
jgi:hypothetical protein